MISLKATALTQRIAMCALLSLLAPADLFAAEPASNRPEVCAPWTGRYLGQLSEDQVFFGQAEKVFVIIDKGQISLELASGDGGAFDATSNSNSCTKDLLRSQLDSGWGGRGRVRMRRAGANIYLKIYGFSEGNGPNKEGYLPVKPTEIEIKEVNKF